jgi:tyrosyl-tRNA synthetase
VTEEEIEKIKTELDGGTNPKEIKMRLAREIVTLYHDSKKALQAEQEFENTFKKGTMPEDAEVIEASSGAVLAELLHQRGVIESKTEFSRLIKEGAISDMKTGEKITSRDYKIEKDIDLRVGKRRFVRIHIMN